MKKIIILCQFAGTPDNGMNYRPYFLAKYFIKNGYETKIVAAGYHHHMKRVKNTTKKIITEEIDGITFIWIPCRRYEQGNTIHRILNFIEFFFKVLIINREKYFDGSADAVIGSSPSLLSGLNGFFLAKRLKSKFIFEVRDLWPLSIVELKGISDKNIIIKFLFSIERFLYRNADKIVTVMKESMEYIEKKAGDVKKIYCLPNGIDPTEDCSNNVPCYVSNCIDIIKNIRKEAFVFGYTGSLGAINAMENVIKAAELVQDLGIVLFIIGEGSKKALLETMVKNNGIKNIYFYQFIEKQYISMIISEFDACIISWHETKLYKSGTSPNKIYEYMYAGKPVLQALSYAKNIVHESGCGITVEAGNPEAFAGGMKEIVSLDKSTLKDMGLRGKQYVEEGYLYNKIASDYLKLIF